MQQDFVENLRQFKRMFDLILEGEKQLELAKSNLTTCEAKKAKIAKEHKKKVANSDLEAFYCENRLLNAERERFYAEVQVRDKEMENEAMKLIRIKKGLIKLSQAYVQMGHKCAIIHDASSNISRQIPDVHGYAAVENSSYTGAGVTKQYVNLAKERVSEYKIRHEPALTDDDFCAPPPYTFQDEHKPDTTPNASVAQCSSGSVEHAATEEDIASVMTSSPQHSHSSDTDSLDQYAEPDADPSKQPRPASHDIPQSVPNDVPQPPPRPPRLSVPKRRHSDRQSSQRRLLQQPIRRHSDRHLSESLRPSSTKSVSRNSDVMMPKVENQGGIGATGTTERDYEQTSEQIGVVESNTRPTLLESVQDIESDSNESNTCEVMSHPGNNIESDRIESDSHTAIESGQIESNTRTAV